MSFRLVQEFSRRRVFRGAGTYVVVAWLALRLVDAVTQPDDPMRRLALLWAVGLFPLAALFSWVFRVTPGAVEREHVEAEPPPRTGSGRAIDMAVLASLTLVVIGEIARRIVFA